MPTADDESFGDELIASRSSDIARIFTFERRLFLHADRPATTTTTANNEDERFAVGRLAKGGAVKGSSFREIELASEACLRERELCNLLSPTSTCILLFLQ